MAKPGAAMVREGRMTSYGSRMTDRPALRREALAADALRAVSALLSEVLSTMPVDADACTAQRVATEAIMVLGNMSVGDDDLRRERVRNAYRLFAGNPTCSRAIWSSCTRPSSRGGSSRA